VRIGVVCRCGLELGKNQLFSRAVEQLELAK
jgi:hypothetical protein